MFIKKIFKKRQRHLVTNYIQENNLIKSDKKKLLSGIILTHCRDHDTILIVFLFEGFYKQHMFTFKKL